MKKNFKSQASSGRAATGTSAFSGFGASGFESSSSPLSYVYEPPNISGISDPNVVVQVKNLMKKDGTTKSKALEDVTAYVTATKTTIEEDLIAAYTKLYPRLSIDSDRRVRQLSHTLVGHIVTKSGKRMVPYLPQIAGPWLCGQYDPDRGTSRSASEAFQRAFNTQEKGQNFRKAFHRQIAEYCKDAVLHETPQTLSDMRNVTKEDAEAIYYRVVATSLTLVSVLIMHSPDEEFEKVSDVYADIVANKFFLELLSAPEPSTRAAVIRVFRSCLEDSKFAAHLDFTLTASVLFSKVLPADQTITAADVLGLLLVLSEQQPGIWTDSKSKKTPDHRLRSFIKKGSQTSSSEYWDTLSTLFDRLPPEILPSDIAASKEWMSALLEGVFQRQEPRHTTSAWSNYFDITDRLSRRLLESDRDAFLVDWVVPVIDQYLSPEEANRKWSMPVSKPESLLAKAFLLDSMVSIMQRKWPEYITRLIDTMKMSQPEQSSEYAKSQDSVKEACRRWASLQLAVLSGQHGVPQDLKQTIEDQASKASQASIDLLVARQGKPYGAASLIGELLRHEDRLLPSEDAQKALMAFLQEDTPSLLFSPSQDALLAALYSVTQSEFFEPTWNAWADHLSKSNVDENSSAAMTKFLTISKTEKVTRLALQHSGVQQVLRAVLRPPQPTNLASDRLKALTSLLSDDTKTELLADSMAALDTSDNTMSVIDTFEVLDQTQPGMLRTFAASDKGDKLLPQIVAIQQSGSGELSEKARQLHDRLLGVDGRPLSPGSSMSLIRRELQSASPTSLPISMVLDITELQLQDSTTELVDILQSLVTPWEAALQLFSWRAPFPSLAIMNPLGGAVYLVESQSKQDRAPVDNEGLSLAVRIAIFARTALQKTADAWARESRQEAYLLSLLSWTALLVDDNINIYGSNNIWIRTPLRQTDDIVTDFVADARKHVNQRLTSMGVDSEVFLEISDINLEGITSTSPIDFCKARSYFTAFSEVTEERGIPRHKVDEMVEDVKQYRKDQKTLALCTVISILSPELSLSGYLQRYLNELVADLTSVEDTKDTKVLQNLVVLNLMLRGSSNLDGLVQKHRLVLLVKHITPWLANGKAQPDIAAQVAITFQTLLPCIHDIYGEHWSDILDAMAKSWKDGVVAYPQGVDEHRLVVVHSTLRLHTVINSMSKQEEPNEDLVDAIKEHKSNIDVGLVGLLVDQRPLPEGDSVPLKITDELIARKAPYVGQISSAIAEDLYPQLDSKSQSLRFAAFDLLRNHVDSAQEQISFDAALEKKAAHLPEQLLSLVLDTPDNDAVLSASFEDNVPSDLQTYLLSWLLVFAHFDKASARVREDYIEDIKSSDHLPPLLDLIYDFLGHTTGKALDASKFPVTTYELNSQENPEKETQALFIHLYYLSLVYLPSLVKQHYLSLTNRVLSNAISTWTAKHISPHVIHSLFTKVTTWSASFSRDPEYENFSIKVSPKTREVTASYLIDEQTMSILVALPESYPLTGASVTGLSRAALDPKKWQSWLRGCQGVIQFSNGDLVDGLGSWRRNVNGALKGQTECAICYSIISGDKQLPTKRCATCKNTFHNSCLFKWFRSSNSSSCPLCRQGWSYSG